MKIILNSSVSLEAFNVREEYNPDFKDNEKMYLDITLHHDKDLSLNDLVGILTKDAISKIIIERNNNESEIITGYTKVTVLRREYLQDRVEVIVRLV